MVDGQYSPLTLAGVIFASTLVAKFARSVRRLVRPFCIIARRPIRAVAAPVPSVLSSLLSVRHLKSSKLVGVFETGYSREICKICYHIGGVGFMVPDEVWKLVVPPRLRDDVLCLGCFTRLADERLIPWDDHIEFFPVSLWTHLQPLP